ncbi:uncharacterized protein LOC18446532 [Amborella trichopoda]|uniref:DUF632 domain-containing protein n=1 Tax=Amborella trichopoda TaxID=13333 RepID=U5D9S7_AMBTC|nr:uncharacterized protein LOC18446532 [Amborella trichopoda]ERN18177.1 hypothetical protein AMTR_s00054p00177020 [Amborella trichopoda]|eukprot:XP_006856710.1 uncharacterized protein LOC18446532 [Amborella trichopoda]
MGCSASKVDDLQVVTLCRERKELVRSAVDHRYAMAAAHLSYIGSLTSMGAALHRFADQETFSLSSPPSSPLLTLPSEGKRKSDSQPNNSSSTSISHSANSPHPSHLHLSSSPSESEVEKPTPKTHDSPPSPSKTSQHGSLASSPVYNYSSSPVWSPVYNYMRSGTAIPSIVFDERARSPDQVRWGDPSSGYSNASFFGAPEIERVPSPPSPPRTSAWDFFNPFQSSSDDLYPYYSQRGGFGVGSESSLDSKEVREKEGIPDLEDEAEQSSYERETRDPDEKFEDAEDRELGWDDSEAATAKSQSHMVDKPELGEGERGSSKSRHGSKEVENSMDEVVSTEHGEVSQKNSVATLSVGAKRDMEEVVKEIKVQFESASDSGKEVSMLLEAGKQRYLPRSTILKVISARILNAAFFPMLPSSRPPSKRSTFVYSRAKKMDNMIHGDLREEFGMISINLSFTLEKLYAWEKKLYEEVKDEEKMRIIYEKKCKRLKVLDDKGAEQDKVDTVQTSIKKLSMKLDIAIKAIDTISNKIHKLRDEELQPQLTELIQGLRRMWKVMFECHQKQCQAIAQGKAVNILFANNQTKPTKSRMKLTLELELEILNWCSSFHNWVNAHKAYVEVMYGWLLRCLVHVPEETPDGPIPFSPSRMGAPPVFVICNDWFQVMASVSEDEVTEAINAFANSMHELWELHGEELRQRLKTEYLSKDLNKRLKHLQKEESKMVVSFSSGEGGDSLHERKVALQSMKKRLEEENAKHAEIVKRIRTSTFGNLQVGLKRIFEAMVNFTSSTLKGFEQLRTPKMGET